MTRPRDQESEGVVGEGVGLRVRGARADVAAPVKYGHGEWSHGGCMGSGARADVAAPVKYGHGEWSHGGCMGSGARADVAAAPGEPST